MHRDQLGEDGGDPVQDAGVGIGETLGPVVQVHRLFVVVAPEFEGQEPLVHQVAHDRADLEAHELLDVPVHAAERAPEQSQCRGDDDVDNRLLPRRGVARVGGGQGRGGQGGEVGGDQRQQRRDQRAQDLHHDGGGRGPEADAQHLCHGPGVGPQRELALRLTSRAGVRTCLQPSCGRRSWQPGPHRARKQTAMRRDPHGLRVDRVSAGLSANRSSGPPPSSGCRAGATP